jgi:hypothetical protein
VSSFDVEVLDVIASDGDARILVRVSGPAVDDTGIAEGFSGSPVLCRGADGIERNIGAISEGTGDYGNKLVLVTPIESVLGETPDPPASADRSPAARALLRRARPLATPVTFSGVSGPLAASLREAGRRTGRSLYAAPSVPRAAFPAQELRPGASVAVGLASGDIAAGAIGTVTYADAGAVWAFGHPLDGAGRRALLLQDAYVYAVIGNPLSTDQTTAYKLGAPGHALGTLTNDAPNAVVGRIGALPDRFPMRITSTDEDAGRTNHQLVEIVDENVIGLPTGTSSLTTVGPIAIAQAAYNILRGSPSRQSADMCVRITVREQKRPLRFCNRYVGGTPGSAGAPMVADFQSAAALLDMYHFGVLHIASVDVNLKMRRDLRQAFLLRMRGPDVVRRGRTVRVRVTAQRARGPRLNRTVRVHVPESASPGQTHLVLTGVPADTDAGSDASMDLTGALTLAFDTTASTDERGPTSLKALTRRVRRIHRDDGVRATFGDPSPSDSGDGPAGPVVLRDPELRFSGTARMSVVVR